MEALWTVVCDCANRALEVWLMEIEIKVPNGVRFFVIGIFVFNCRNKNE